MSHLKSRAQSLSGNWAHRVWQQDRESWESLARWGRVPLQCQTPTNRLALEDDDPIILGSVANKKGKISNPSLHYIHLVSQSTGTEITATRAYSTVVRTSFILFIPCVCKNSQYSRCLDTKYLWSYSPLWGEKCPELFQLLNIKVGKKQRNWRRI